MSFAACQDPIRRPHNWEKVKAAAAFYLVCGTAKQTARMAGISERTLRYWKRCSWWPEAVREAASEPWLVPLVEQARRTLLEGVKSDPRLALRILERLDPRLAPPGVQYRRERDRLKELDRLSDEQLAELEQMGDDEIMEWFYGSS